MSVKSILREEQYSELSKLSLSGKILDLGGTKNGEYQKLIKGDHVYTTVNIDERYGFDLNFNIENKFPLQDNEFDNVLAINLIEHIMDTNNVFSETARVLKPGGQFVATIPFMHHIHGSPDDFVRLTKSAYEKLASKYGFEIIYMEELGGGLFSFIFQSLIIRNWWRLDVIFNIAKFLFVTMDNILHIIPGYGGFAKLIPLGYFFIMKKK